MHGFRRRFSILLVFLFGFFVPARAELSLLPLEERAPVSLECKSARPTGHPGICAISQAVDVWPGKGLIPRR